MAKEGRLKAAKGLLGQTVKEFFRDRCPKHAAAISYYTAFAVAPMLVVVMALVAVFLGADGAREAVLAPLGDLLGPGSAALLEDLVRDADESGKGATAAAVGALVLLVGATGAVWNLQDSINDVWGVPRREGAALLRVLRERFLSLAMVLGLAFLLMVSLVVSAGWDAVGRFLLPEGGWARGVFQVVHVVLAVALFTVLIAAIYRILPDALIAWKDVWVGAFATAVLLTAGKSLLGLYLGQGAFGSAYGAASSLAVLLAWVYYASLIFFLGAEFTQVYADRHGSLVRHKGKWPPLKARVHREGGHEADPR
ncbi:MAG TPA: YihY/virulence factor BrkB family protein [Candidatus Thermoplasmatota archaeon]|nr:YihY/virulence factor BrkB family protein [Candidatus Thermoplasmatota archaeon]